MAKAKATTREWILLAEALPLLVAYCRSPDLAKQTLLRALRAGSVHWRADIHQGRRHPTDPGAGDKTFWYPGGNGHVNWDESWARRRGRFGTYTVYRIMTPRDEVLCLIPASSRPRMDSTKARITLKELLERVIEQIPFFPPEERTHGWKAKWNEQAAAAINKLRKDKKPTSARSVGARMNQYKLWPE